MWRREEMLDYSGDKNYSCRNSVVKVAQEALGTLKECWHGWNREAKGKIARSESRVSQGSAHLALCSQCCFSVFILDARKKTSMYFLSMGVIQSNVS